MGWCEENGKWPIELGHKNFAFFGYFPSDQWQSARPNSIPTKLWCEVELMKFETPYQAIRSVDAAAVKLGMHGTRLGIGPIPSACKGYSPCFPLAPVESLRPRVVMVGAGLS